MNKLGKRMLTLLAGIFALWLVIFLINTILDCKIGFDYDDTLTFSTPSFRDADRRWGPESISYRDSEYVQYWTEVNRDPQRDKVKRMTMILVQAARLLGCDAVIITARPEIDTAVFADYWDETFREIYFTEDKQRILKSGNYLVFFGDSDSDMEEAKKAGILGIRVRRHPSSSYKAKYNPGSHDELIVPFSEGPN